MNFQEPIGGLVERIARALERLAPPSPRKPDFDKAEAFIWQAEPEAFLPVGNVNRVPLSLLKGIDRMRDALHDNTVRFARGLPANNALLWGARGSGKSSLVKAVHAAVGRETRSQAGALKLVEIHREDIGSLPRCLAHLRNTKGRRFILFCDDLSFEARDTSYKSLKAMLEGGIEGRPEHVLFYATSNRRHLMPRDELDGGKAGDSGWPANSGQRDSVDEMISLSDRFGLWIGFHNCSQDDYLDMVRGYVEYYGLRIADEDLRREALAWAITRGSRSGRVASQYILDLAGRLGVPLAQT
jgi:predicted AAA+ superfamily ATPase